MSFRKVFAIVPIHLEWLGLGVVSVALGLILIRGASFDEPTQKARQLLSELKALERAGKLWAEAEGKEAGTWASYEQVKPYIRPQSRKLVKRGELDGLGNSWKPFQVGEGFYALPNKQSWEELTPVVGEEFWHPREGWAQEG